MRIATQTAHGMGAAAPLLGAGDPPPAIVDNPRGRSPFLLIGDHAGDAIPARLGDLGLTAADRARHIALDIGTAALGAALVRRLDAVFVRQRYSRLVIDCNRAPDAPDAMPEESDASVVPGNRALDDAARAARIAAIHAPYHAAIAGEIARRGAAGQPTILVSLHSFTPIMAGIARPWQIGILHAGGAPAFARALLAALHARGGLVVGDNAPYRMDATDHSVPRHAFAARLRYAEIEIRQDLLATAPGIARWSDIVADTLAAAAAVVGA